MDLALPCHFIHIYEDSFRENYRYKFPHRLTYRATFKIGPIYRGFYNSGTSPISQPIVTTSDFYAKTFRLNLQPSTSIGDDAR